MDICKYIYVYVLIQSTYMWNYCWVPTGLTLQLKAKIAFDECTKLSLVSWCLKEIQVSFSFPWLRTIYVFKTKALVKLPAYNIWQRFHIFIF